MAKKYDNELLVRIDERVKTVFNELTSMKSKQDEANKRHYHCQTEIIPKMMIEIKSLKERPLGLTAFLAVIFKRIL